MKQSSFFETASIAFVVTWLTVFAAIPFIFVVIVSFLTHQSESVFILKPTIANYRQVFNSVYWSVFEKSLLIAGSATFLCLLFAYPFAYLLSRIKSAYKQVLLVMVMIPFWMSSLIRSYAMVAILKAKGVINSFLLLLGLIHHPTQLLFTNTAVIIGLVYNLMPFMILPLYTNLERLDRQLIEAAQDLGASRRVLFQKIIFPLSMPGIISGCIIVFLPAMTLFYITDLLGGAKSMLLGNLIRDTFLQTQNWPLGSAISVVLLLITGLLLLARWGASLRNKNNKERQEMLQ